ncbi:MAG: hypothetical protein HFH67_06650 [Lachnospiraceae bacterium]|nr:hypothetical protein [Lachnospiraceae bacterium]
MVTRLMVYQMENILDRYNSILKKHLNILLLEEYLSGLEFYFMPDGSLKMLYIASDNTKKISIPYIALTDYTPVFVDKITINKI